MSGEKLQVVGSIKVDVRCSTLSNNLELIIVKSNERFRPLLDRDWFNVIFPEWKDLFKKQVKVVSQSKEVCQSSNLIKRNLNFF